MKHRALFAAIIFTFTMLIFTIRLIFLQLTPTSLRLTMEQSNIESWKEHAVHQRQKNLMLDSGRGNFVDKNGKYITGEVYKTVAFFPTHFTVKENVQAKYNKVANILKTNSEKVEAFWNELTEAQFWKIEGQDRPIRLTAEQIKKLEDLQIDGMKVVPYRDRYPSTFAAKHFIGFISQHPEWVESNYEKEIHTRKGWSIDSEVGGIGLEKSLDRLLHGIGATYISNFIDGQYSALHGIGFRVTSPQNEYYPLKVKTTIDLKLQNEIEQYLDHMNFKKGAVVVLDASNGEIRSIISRPKLYPGQFTSSDGSEWRNHALTAYSPGSVYKMVTAAAALEFGVVEMNESFYCSGEYGKYGLSCWKKEGHGELTFEEAIAHSCNVVFAEVAERLTSQQLEAMAYRLGMINPVGWHADEAFGPFSKPVSLLEEEEAGILFHQDTAVDGGVMAQSGIGQRDVRITPLQAGQLIVTLLNNGKRFEPKIVDEILFADDQRMVKFPAHYNDNNISAHTARQLRQAMQNVIRYGTGQTIKNGIWDVAGKSGTAEANQSLKQNHQWFVGYGPLQSPQYAVAVLVLDQPANSKNEASQIFRKVMDIAASQ